MTQSPNALIGKWRSGKFFAKKDYATSFRQICVFGIKRSLAKDLRTFRIKHCSGKISHFLSLHLCVESISNIINLVKCMNHIWNKKGGTKIKSAFKISFFTNSSFIYQLNCNCLHRYIDREDRTSKHRIIRIIPNMKIFIQCYPVFSFWTLGCNAISWRAVKTHILKTWRHAKCTTFDIYEIVSWTRTRYQGCRKSFWYDVDFAANKKLVQKKRKNTFQFQTQNLLSNQKEEKIWDDRTRNIWNKLFCFCIDVDLVW